jgi:heat shock protein HslJ
MRSGVAWCGALLILGLVAGCGGDHGSGTSASGEAGSLAEVPWVLAGGLDVQGWEDTPPSATFADGTVGGSTGCNRFTAPYTFDGDSLEIGTIAATRMACLPPADQVERAYLDALGQVAGWRREGSSLVLLDDDENELLRYDAATPVGEWEATVIQTGDALTSPLPGTRVTATFADDGTLTGSAGCNNYRTSYTTDRGGIEIAPPAATKKTCASPVGVMTQEAAYRRAPDGRSLQARRRLAGAAARRRDLRRFVRAHPALTDEVPGLDLTLPLDRDRPARLTLELVGDELVGRARDLDPPRRPV